MGERTQQQRRALPSDAPAGGAKVAGPRHRQLVQLAAALNGGRGRTAGADAGRGSGAPLPDALRSGVETLSGLAMDHVRVHYNSDRPAQLQAHAFAQGHDIHLAPGQERHLPHEAWHVVQQAQGRVSPTAQMKGGVAVNDEAGLEREADAMGARALATPAGEAPTAAGLLQAKAVVQRAVWEYADSKWVQIDGKPGATPPSGAAPVEGMVYNDETGIAYEDVHDYALALRDQVLGTDDLPDDDMSNEYKEAQDDEDEDEDEDDDAMGANDNATVSNVSDMDIEERKKLGVDALKRPFDTSLLTAPSARFPSHAMTSTDKFKVGKVMGQRSQQSGAVTITLQTVGLWVNDALEMRERPISISGIVEPTKTTGRGGAPDPLSGVQIYSGGGSQPKASVATERNTGIPDAERGHIMALELGGPDIPQNIVPQWAKFQGSGEWRRMEVAVLAKAMKLPKGEQLRYKVEIFYKDSGILTPTLRTFGFPTGFKATTQIVSAKAVGPEVVEFHQGQAQDQTDQMLAERKMSVLDGSDWDTGLNIGKPKAPRKPRQSVKARKPSKLDYKANSKKAAAKTVRAKRGMAPDGVSKPKRARITKKKG